MAKRLTRKEAELATTMHLLEYMQSYLARFSRPRHRLDALESAIEEIGRVKLMLGAEVEEGSPSLRRLSRPKKEER